MGQEAHCNQPGSWPSVMIMDTQELHTGEQQAFWCLGSQRINAKIYRDGKYSAVTDPKARKEKALK